MKSFYYFLLLLSSCLLFQATYAQKDRGDLFGSEDILPIKLSGNVRELYNDRGDVTQYHSFNLSYKGGDSTDITLAVKAKTRGHFRRDKSNCINPPVLLNFTGKDKEATLFKDQSKLKLVTPCRSENYIVREYLVYKLYNLLTPKSYRARLVRTTFFDNQKQKETSFLGMLLEEDEQMAKRNKTKILNKKMIRGEATETETFLKMAVFQYMIGNTDWSVPYLHNIRIVAFDSASIPYVVPYDFDYSGIVDAPYAVPPEELGLESTRNRRFRGYCITDWKTFDDVIATFNRLKKDIYETYTACKLLDAKYISTTIRFLDGFYETINNPKKSRAEFTYPCNSSQVLIKGLDN